MKTNIFYRRQEKEALSLDTLETRRTHRTLPSSSPPFSPPHSVEQVEGVPEDEEHPAPEEQQDAAGGDALLHLRGELFPPPHRLERDEQQEPSVERGQGQDVHDGEVDVDDARELVQPREIARPHHLRADADDGDGPRDVLLGGVEIAHEREERFRDEARQARNCLLYTSPSPRDKRQSRMPSSA